MKTVKATIIRNTKATIIRNTVQRGAATGRFYFVPRIAVLRGGRLLVSGQKIDVTASLLPYLLKKYRVKP